jgi:hypothetical protein
MRSRTVALAVIAVGVAALLLTAALRDTSLAFTLGVTGSAGVAPLKSRDEVCQRPIDVPVEGEFDTVVARVGTFFRAGSPLAVTVEDERGTVLARGRVAGGYPDIGRLPEHRIALDRTVDEGRVAVCIRNAGDRRVSIYGSPSDLAARSSTAYRDRRPINVDLALEFEREPRSIAGLVPQMFDRASLFRFAWLGPWAHILLAALLLVAGPWLLLRALGSAVASSRVD